MINNGVEETERLERVDGLKHKMDFEDLQPTENNKVVM